MKIMVGLFLKYLLQMKGMLTCTFGQRK